MLFFDKKVARPASRGPNLWVYDLRTNKHFTLKQNPLRRADLDEFVMAYKAGKRGERGKRALEAFHPRRNHRAG